jgi:hypothetical protein
MSNTFYQFANFLICESVAILLILNNCMVTNIYIHSNKSRTFRKFAHLFE